MKFNVKWSVTEHYSGNGDDGPGREIRDGQSEVVASGEVEKEAEAAENLREELLRALKSGYPESGMGGTYDIDRTYEIEITPIEEFTA